MPAEIQPQLWVSDTSAAVSFYEQAFGAVVAHRVGTPEDRDGVVQLAIGPARFWVSSASAEMARFDPRRIGGGTSRYLLVVDDPDTVAHAAVAAGAQLSSPVAHEHGWLVGRITDPFGHEWEIGRPLRPWPPAD